MAQSVIAVVEEKSGPTAAYIPDAEQGRRVGVGGGANHDYTMQTDNWGQSEGLPVVPIGVN